MEIFAKLVGLVIIAVTLVMLWNSDTVIALAEIVFGRDDELPKLAAELSRLIELSKTAPELYRPVIDDICVLIGEDVRRLRLARALNAPSADAT